MKDSTLYQRAAQTARTVPEAAKVIRALLAVCHRKDRELAEWKEGRAHNALIAENDYLKKMVRERRGA